MMVLWLMPRWVEIVARTDSRLLRIAMQHAAMAWPAMQLGQVDMAPQAPTWQQVSGDCIMPHLDMCLVVVSLKGYCVVLQDSAPDERR